MSNPQEPNMPRVQPSKTPQTQPEIATQQQNPQAPSRPRSQLSPGNYVVIIVVLVIAGLALYLLESGIDAVINGLYNFVGNNWGITGIVILAGAFFLFAALDNDKNRRNKK